MSEAPDELQLRVVTDKTDEDAARTERRDVARDIAGAADHRLGAIDGDHRRRRLRRDARHIAIDEVVEHDVIELACTCSDLSKTLTDECACLVQSFSKNIK